MIVFEYFPLTRSDFFRNRQSPTANHIIISRRNGGTVPHVEDGLMETDEWPPEKGNTCASSRGHPCQIQIGDLSTKWDREICLWIASSSDNIELDSSQRACPKAHVTLIEIDHLEERPSI